MSEISTSEIEAFSHARSIHCRVIARDFNRTPQPVHRKPHGDFTLPNDRGALIGPGTFRLPLERHVCAETLWRFFGDMGERDDCPLRTVQLLQSQWKGMDTVREQWVTFTISMPECSHTSVFHTLETNTRTLLERPSFVASEDFGNWYCLHIYLHSKQQALTFVEILFGKYGLLLKHHPTRPIFMDQRAWDEEIRLKRATKWIMRMNEQYLGAEANASMGDRQVLISQLSKLAHI
jgi:hypothetical protein